MKLFSTLKITLFILSTVSYAEKKIECTVKDTSAGPHDYLTFSVPGNETSRDFMLKPSLPFKDHYVSARYLGDPKDYFEMKLDTVKFTIYNVPNNQYQLAENSIQFSCLVEEK